MKIKRLAPMFAALILALLFTITAGLTVVGAQGTVDYDADDETALNKTQALSPRVCLISEAWNSEIIQNRLLRSIMSLGYGYTLGKCPFRNTSSSSLIDEISNSSDMVIMEFWLGNAGPETKESWIEAIQRGKLYSPGSSIKPNWQSAFVIPKYLQEQYPELDSVEDLKDDKYKALFATSKTGGKAHLVSCPVGWLCEQVTAEQIEGYGLSGHIEIVNAESQDDLFADLENAYSHQEPWLGYAWATSRPNLLLDLVRLEEPTYNDRCWATTKACAYEDAAVHIAVSYSLQETAPDFIDVLRKWDFDIDRVYKPISRYSATNPDDDAVEWWLKNNDDIWKNWVTEDAAFAIQSSLNVVPTATATVTVTPTFIPTHTPTPVGGSAPPPATATFIPIATVTHTSTSTNTATPTNTPVPTETPTPTDTPVPTATPTFTAIPTATPIPTDTPIPTPTATHTPLPTDTPAPAATAEPTATVVPPTQTPQVAVVVVTATPGPDADAPTGGGCNSVGRMSAGAGAMNLLLLVAPLSMVFAARRWKFGVSRLFTSRHTR